MDPLSVPQELYSADELYVRQQRELAELFGFETRNKYAISTADRAQVAFAAEQQKGFLGMLFRQLAGHWRSFEITFFGADRQPIFRAVHPFRFFFQRLEVYAPSGELLGALQQRFGVLTKKFDVEDARGNVLFEMRSSLFQLWTFPFYRAGEQMAVIEKRWSGGLTELFTDKDNFRVRYGRAGLDPTERLLILAAAIFVDLQYFEKKAD